MKYHEQGQASSRLPGNLLGNCKVPGSMPSWGFLLLLFPWTRNFTPIASATQQLNWENTVLYIVCKQGTAEKQLHSGCCHSYKRNQNIKLSMNM